MRSRIIFIAVVVFSILVVSLVPRTAEEPSSGGKPLHAWLEQIDGVVFRVTTAKGMELETTNAAIDAVMSMAPDAMPWLRQELRARNHRLWLQNAVYRLPARLQPRWLMRLVASASNPTLWERHRRAAMATLILGVRAKSLAPELADLLNSGDSCSLYAFTLARIAPEGIAPLAKALTNSYTQFNALAALEITAASTEPAVPALLCVLTNGGGYPSIQEAFLNARGKAQAIAPVLRAAVSHTNWVVRASAESTLRVLETGRVNDRQTSELLRVDRHGNWSNLGDR